MPAGGAPRSGCRRVGLLGRDAGGWECSAWVPLLRLPTRAGHGGDARPRPAPREALGRRAWVGLPTRMHAGWECSGQPPCLCLPTHWHHGWVPLAKPSQRGSPGQGALGWEQTIGRPSPCVPTSAQSPAAPLPAAPPPHQPPTQQALPPWYPCCLSLAMPLLPASACLQLLHARLATPAADRATRVLRGKGVQGVHRARETGPGPHPCWQQPLTACTALPALYQDLTVFDRTTPARRHG
jgi:hypothetical protein